VTTSGVRLHGDTLGQRRAQRQPGASNVEQRAMPGINHADRRPFIESKCSQPARVHVIAGEIDYRGSTSGSAGRQTTGPQLGRLPRIGTTDGLERVKDGEGVGRHR
jgi:hypothetical protein